MRGTLVCSYVYSWDVGMLRSDLSSTVKLTNLCDKPGNAGGCRLPPSVRSGRVAAHRIRRVSCICLARRSLTPHAAARDAGCDARVRGRAGRYRMRRHTGLARGCRAIGRRRIEVRWVMPVRSYTVCIARLEAHEGLRERASLSERKSSGSHKFGSGMTLSLLPTHIAYTSPGSRRRYAHDCHNLKAESRSPTGARPDASSEMRRTRVAMAWPHRNFFTAAME